MGSVLSVLISYVLLSFVDILTSRYTILKGMLAVFVLDFSRASSLSAISHKERSAVGSKNTQGLRYHGPLSEISKVLRDAPATKHVVEFK